MRINIAGALSSEVTWRILDLLMAGELAEPKISGYLGIEQALLKPYLERLLSAGLIVKREETLPSGERALLYSLSRTDRSVGFPPRNYLNLSETLINGLVKSLGEDGARRVLRDIGLRIGEDIIRALKHRTKQTKWDPHTFSEQFVKGLLVEAQTYPQLVKVGRNQVIYEQHNCPYLELAIKYPGLLCDVLDESIREGIDRELNFTKTTCLKCQGHRDTVCKFSVKWGIGVDRIEAGQSQVIR